MALSGQEKPGGGLEDLEIWVELLGLWTAETAVENLTLVGRQG